MPFVGRDWRSPGELWVKTDEGWEKKKLLERLMIARNARARERLALEGIERDDNDNTLININNENDNDDNGPDVIGDHAVNCVNDAFNWQPYCPVTIKCTREIAGFNGLGEAFKRLDFRNAVKDIRRFHYVCKLLHLIITKNLTMLSGCAQKFLFTMLEEIAFQVSSNQTNMHILQKLVGEIEKTMYEYYCWGRPLGSSLLQKQHIATIDRISLMARSIQIKQPDDTIFPKLQDLPEECVREILLRLSDHKDLQNGGQAYRVMGSLLDEQHIWRELCKFHFNDQQISYVISGIDGQGVRKRVVDWQQIYHKLRRLYGLREEYAEILQLCRQCRCLFWKSFGHPCFVSDTESPDGDEPVDKSTMYVPIPPQAFLKFFSL